MSRTRRSNLIGGIILILIGAWFLAGRWFPGFDKWFGAQFSWPYIVIGVGVLLFILGLLVNAPEMAVPACIVGGIGGLLYWQNATGNWESWAYAWTLIPGFVGVGMILSAVLHGSATPMLRGGAWLLFISLVLFLIFSTALGGKEIMGPYWPVLLILFGGWLLIKPLLRRR